MDDYSGRLKRLAAEAFAGPGRQTWLRQLRSATLLEGIRQPEVDRPEFTFDPVQVAQAADLIRLAELTRSPAERRRDPGQLPAVAQAYADLAARLPSGVPRRAELLMCSASAWSLAGYQANAAKLARDYLAELDTQAGSDPLAAAVPDAVPAAIAMLAAAIVGRDVSTVARLGARADEAVPVLADRLLAQTGEEPLDDVEASMLAAYGLVGRAGRSLARFWLKGVVSDGQAAVTDLRTAVRLVLNANVVDTWVLLDNLAHVVEDIVATSPWRQLRRAATFNRIWTRYLRAQALADHPFVQVWPSQRDVLKRGLLDRGRPNLTVTMPTSAGKTHVAEWAILDALATPAPLEEPARLAVYVVPTRALATQVERHLSASLGQVGFRVSGLFGGTEHVAFEQHLIDGSDVLVVTSEKLDLMLRNNPDLAERLALVVTDEGHLLGEGERGLRLELLLTRIRRHAPAARLLLLSAVLPNAADVAAWLSPDDRHLAEVTWTPSQVNIGVFSWKGAEVDGQQGFVEYRAEDVDHRFFLPHVLTRHRKRTKLFPAETKDVAAALALHYVRLGPVLVAVPQRRYVSSHAHAVLEAVKRAGLHLGAGPDGVLPEEVAEARGRVLQQVFEYAGADHELVHMVARGIGYHHAHVPEPIRHELERAYRAGALQVLIATSTLGQGVNLPAKTVIVAGVQRGRGDQLPVRDFDNLAGRAARPFQETEGHVILVPPPSSKPADIRRLRRRYLDDPRPEHVRSTMVRLYVALVKARIGPLPGSDIPDTLELHDPEEDDPATWSDALDLQLLSALAEEVFDTDDEALLTDAVAGVLGDTFAAAQLRARSVTLTPLIRYAARRVRAVAQRVPEPQLRQAFLRTGLSLAGCQTALTAAQALIDATTADPGLLTFERWGELRALLLEQAVHVTELRDSALRKKIIRPAAVALIAADWIDGHPLPDIRARHRDILPSIDAMAFADLIDKVIVQDLAWVLSSIISLWEHLASDPPLPSHLTCVPAMAKYGVADEAACYAASIGVRNRADAIALARGYHDRTPDPFELHAPPGFPRFLAWATYLDPATLTGLVSAPTANLLAERTAALSTPRQALALAATDNGTLTTPLRGIGPLGTRDQITTLRPGTELALIREPANPHDPNAIAVHLPSGPRLAYLPRPLARILAPVLDTDDRSSCTTTLTSAGAGEADPVTVTIHLNTWA